MRLYVLVRSDLSIAYASVQAGHALAEFMLRHPGRWKNETLVYLSVKNETELAMWSDLLRSGGAAVAEFREPDIDDQLTAIAAQGADRMLRRLPLVKGEK